MRIKCKYTVPVMIIILVLILLRWLFALDQILWYMNPYVLLAQLVDNFGLPSTLYMKNVSCSGCNSFSTSYLIEPPQTTYCTFDKPVFLLMLVLSRADSYNRRMAIRQSWGSISAHKEQSIRTFYICGRTTNVTVQVLLENEAERWHDILQVCLLIFCKEYFVHLH